MNRQKREAATKWSPNVGDKAAVVGVRYDLTTYVLPATVKAVTKDAILTSDGKFSRFTLGRIHGRTSDSIRPWTEADDKHRLWVAARSELFNAARELCDNAASLPTEELRELTSKVVACDKAARGLTLKA